jgi:hypothetical protein
MRAVPADFDLSPLCGQELAQIRLGRFNLQLCFDQEHRIACEGTVIAVTNGGSVEVFSRESGWKDASVLPDLVGRTVIGWKREGSHEFSISLSGETKLRFQSSDGPYEDSVIHPVEVVV